MRLRNLFLLFSGVFWLGVGYYVVRCPHDAAPLAKNSSGTSPPPLLPGGRLPIISGVDLAKHHAPSDCWMVVNGVVYDLSAYIAEHPGKRREIDGYCGKDGTKAWEVKESGPEKGETHSVKAFQILAELPRVGILKR